MATTPAVVVVDASAPAAAVEDEASRRPLPTEPLLSIAPM
jgi:hypothetical protein